jgi:PAS domain S-box-containing protein
MTREVAYLLPYLASWLISVSLGAYGWSRRKTPGATGFVMMCWSEALWTFGFVVESMSIGLGAKITWDNVQFIAMFGTVISAVVMAYEYSRHDTVDRRRLWLYLSILPAVCLPLIFLDPGGILRPSSVLIVGDPYASLYYPFSPFFWLMVLYAYGMIIAAEVILVRGLFGAKAYYRRQTLWLVAGIAVPLIASFGSTLELLPPAQRDISPLTFVLGNLVVSVGLFRFRLFDVVPIAREKVVEGLDSAVVVIDSRDRVVDFNHAAETLLGLSHDQLGKSISQLQTGWAEIAARAEPGLGTRKVIEGQKEGGGLSLDLSISPIFDASRVYLGRIISIRDITAQAKTQQELSRRTRQLENTNRELESFASAVSHDLRAPLRSIRGFSQILLKDFPEQLRGEPAELLQHVLDATSEMNELIESLLSLSRQTRAEIVRGPVNLTEMAWAIAAKLDESDRSRPVSWKIADGLTVTADERLARTALENLLGNAWKYTGPVTEPRIEFGSQLRDGETVYFVRDNGVGFDMQNAENLFSPFRRLEGSQEFPGEGIGLATVQRIIHRHNGRIWAESEPGEGAVFYFTLK